MNILRVFPENIQGIWDQVSPLLEKALELQGTHDAEDIRKALMIQACQLWVTWEDRVTSALVTEFVSYPKGLWCRVWLTGSVEGSDIDWTHWADAIEQFAKFNGCRGLEISGRPGWLRLFSDRVHSKSITLRSIFA